MRIPQSAVQYLTWLPKFHDAGIDVLIGNFSGSSPNPPLHGIRGQLHDVLTNLEWLSQLNDSGLLPGRSVENRAFRNAFPDYYYDLSRKHTNHLQETMWIEPGPEIHNVADGQRFIVEAFPRLLTGEPYLRPLIVNLPKSPLDEAIPSCNRGGNTFVFNPKALTETPNFVLLSDGKENRRSDMLWAIVNVYTKDMDIRAVSFPVHHHRTIGNSHSLNIEKTIAEIRGAGLYAGLLKCLRQNPESLATHTVYSEMKDYIHQRLSLYEANFAASRDLLSELKRKHPELYHTQTAVFDELKRWVSVETLAEISQAAINIDQQEVALLLESSNLSTFAQYHLRV